MCIRKVQARLCLLVFDTIHVMNANSGNSTSSLKCESFAFELVKSLEVKPLPKNRCLVDSFNKGEHRNTFPLHEWRGKLFLT